MFVELIATFFAAIGVVGLVLLLNRISGGRLPKWSVPVAAGLTMIGYTIWSEYSWADRKKADLPEGMVVLREIEETAVWKPWTYLAPQVTGLVVLDSATVRRKEDAADMRLVEMYLFGRWRRPANVPQLVDCAAPARADVSDEALSDPQEATWRALDRSDPLITRVCGGAN